MFRITRIQRGVRVVALLILTSSLGHAIQGTDLYVDDDAPLRNTGTSWGDAFKYLRDAVDIAGPDDVIHVAEGTYRPDLSEGAPGDRGDRMAYIYVQSSIQILGGYAGMNAVDPDERDTDVYESIVTGDLSGDDGGLLDPSNVNEADPLKDDNSRFVMYVGLGDSDGDGVPDGPIDVTLDGIIIQDGFHPFSEADGSPGMGAGLVFGGDASSTLFVNDCVIRGNYAENFGAGIFNLAGQVILSDSEVSGNVSRSGAGYMSFGSATLSSDRCVFEQNHLIATDDGDACFGAAICLQPFQGAGLGLVRETLFLENSSNTGLGAGKGVIYVGTTSAGFILNNTFKGNSAESGRGGATIYCENQIAGIIFSNNVCWDASPSDNHMRYPSAGTASFGYNDIEDLASNQPPAAMDGEGNFEGDPDFQDSYGRIGGESACIDAGMNMIAVSTADFDLRDRIIDDPESSASGLGGPNDGATPGTPGLRPIVDVGAFEYFRDCNDNGVLDSEDVSSGFSDDCNSNGKPDECEDLDDCNENDVPDECETLEDCDGNGTADECEEITDCNGNMIPDFCDIEDGTSTDCDEDGVPDECDLIDCNGNTIPDSCDIANGTSLDCNTDGVPDECGMTDCNANGVPDECDIAAGDSEDCQPDGVPDECQDDCNENGIDDSCDIADGTSSDCNSNGTPDECEGLDDCNEDGTPDICQILEDCNEDGIPDECQVLEDCNGDTIPDACQFLQDCQPNGVPDICEVFDDCDGNGVPDECQDDCDGDGLPDVCETDCQPNGVPDDCEAWLDCNGNLTPDECDIAEGDSPDCDSNGVPDECDPDCDGDGAPDACELASGTAEDCDGNDYPDNCQPDCDNDGTIDPCEEDCDKNGVPDDCQAWADCNANDIPDQCEDDCDGDGEPDDCEEDCQGNGIPDACEAWPDCNSNGIPDECDIASGFSEDCNTNAQPDECDPDCDNDGFPDDCEIAAGAEDCDGNGIPDECQPDCNGNGIADPCDVASGFSEDCNENLVPDECEPDCNENGQVDECDILQGLSEDCNANIIPDECEFPEGDQNFDGVLDDCELPCVEFNRYEMLTPGDTFTAITNSHNPQQEAGFVYINASDKHGTPVAYNHLIGTLLVVDGIELFEYQMNAVSFPSPVEGKGPTDLDDDGNLDLNGQEYAMAPDEILVPRFFGQGGDIGMMESKMLLIGLSGGSEFDTVVEFLAANDNEELFSAEFSFRCWAKVDLTRISSLFTQDFLQNYTAHDPGEVFGAPGLESGWFRARGRAANSVASTIHDPAIYGVLIERAGSVGVADLPFEIGSRAGRLLPHAVVGDNEEASGANFSDPDASVHRRAGGSLLLYPEFDNRDGVFSVITVTNTGQDAVLGHIVYVGRYQQL